MREATSGKYPRYAIWENVPGAFSSNNGNDFRAVLEEITEAKIPIPKSGKWGGSGLVRGNGREIAWRVLDAQYWGVPQRRKRIFLVADFAGQRAGKILFEQQSMSGDIEQGRAEREKAAAIAGNGVETTGFRMLGFGHYAEDTKASALKQRDYKDATDLICFEPRSQDGVPRIHGNISPTLNTMGGGSGNLASSQQLTYGFSAGNSAKAGSIGFNEEVSPTLRAGNSGTNMVPTIAFNGRQDPVHGAITGALNTGHPQDQCVAHAVDVRNLYETPELSGTLQSKNSGGYSLNYQNPVRIGYRVRRLTPTECLRLQGFPDWWLDIEGASDSAKYKATGNSVANPCPDFIFSRI